MYATTYAHIRVHVYTHMQANHFIGITHTCRTEDALGELLREIHQHSHSVRFDAMTNIIANHCQSEGVVSRRERE